jgi:hypothetical protein
VLITQDAAAQHDRLSIVRNAALGAGRALVALLVTSGRCIAVEPRITFFLAGGVAAIEKMFV